MKVAIIEYNAGNVQSVQNALQRIGIQSVVTSDAEELQSADRVIFPGVGEASSAMRYLQNKGLDKIIPALTQPFLGICLGQQLMCRKIEEGNCVGLGIFEVDVCRFPPQDLVPHMGWNNLSAMKNPLFEGISEDEDFYFVHSYYCGISENTAAVCDYILPFSAALQRDNFFAVQFHPEKSGSAGAKLITNFINITL